jgi:hypothetical protein
MLSKTTHQNRGQIWRSNEIYQNIKTHEIIKFDNKIQGAKFNFTRICEKIERSFATNDSNSTTRNNLKFHT